MGKNSRAGEKQAVGRADPVDSKNDPSCHGSILIAVGLGGMPRDPAQLAKMIPIMVLAMLAGPVTCSPNSARN
jgi:hypothetical protein